MLGRFKKHEEEWTPISEWGRKMKADRERMNIVTVMKPQVMKKRIRVSNTPYVAGKCSLCPGHIGPQNKSGICSKCFNTSLRRNLVKGPRPKCKVCGVTVNRDNTKFLCPTHKAAAFSSRKCSQCPTSIREDNKSGLCRIHALVGRKIVHVSIPKNPVGRPKGFKLITDRKCGECDSYLRRDNVSGLCAKHSVKFWNKVNAQRRKAA